jgi:hypothetical protein
MNGKTPRLSIWSLLLEVWSPRMLNFPRNDWSDQFYIIIVLDGSHIFNDHWKDHFSLNWSQDLLCSPLGVFQFILKNKIFFLLFSDIIPFLEFVESFGPFFEQNFLLNFECFFVSLHGRKSLQKDFLLDSWLTLDGPNFKLLVFFRVLYQIFNKTTNALPFDCPWAITEGKISMVYFLGVFCLSCGFSSRIHERFSDKVFSS